MFEQGLLMSHVLFGVLGILLGVALFVDVLNSNPNNAQRIKLVSLAVAAAVVLSYLLGGYWYVTLYGADRAIIKAGQWPWAHNYFMEVKEHVFFLMLLLAVYLPIVVHKSLPLIDRGKRNLILGIAALIVLIGLSMESAGAIISKGVTMGLIGR